MTVESRFRAEWERHGVIMLAWPHRRTDWAYMLDEVQECYLRIIEALLVAGQRVLLLSPSGEAPLLENPLLSVVEVETNDTWIRDYGPLTLSDRLLDFRFNAWGGKFSSELDNRVTAELVRKKIISVPVESHKDFVLEGGSIETDGQGTLLTTSCCLLAPNRNEPLGRKEIEHELLRRLRCRKVLWIDNGSLSGDDTDGHVDTLCRLAPGNSIVYTGCSNPADEHYDALTAMATELREMTNADGEPFNLVELPLPDAIVDPDEGIRLPATYANYLVTDTHLFLPTYNQPLNDELAANTLRIVFPNHIIVPIDCRALIRQHGSLHCATMQAPIAAFTLF